MEKYNRVSLLEVCFVFLFVCNCLLIFLSIIEDRQILSSLAVILSVFQIMLYRYLVSRDRFLRDLSFKASLKYFLRLCWFSGGADLTKCRLSTSDRVLISKRARNMPANIVNHCGVLDEGLGIDPLKYEGGLPLSEQVARVEVGTAQCSQPYSLSILNSVSSGLLSPNELHIISRGAKLGQFALFTGSAGLQAAHIRGGADLVWQYSLPFACIINFEYSDECVFFRRNSLRPYIKMIEISIRGSEKYQYGMWIDEYNKVSFEKKFGRWENNVEDLSQILTGLSKLRQLSDGKPLGIRLPLKKEEDVLNLFQSISRTSIIPDFITIDQSSGYPILACVKQHIERSRLSTVVLYSGVIVSELDIFKAVSSGASACISTTPVIKAISTGLFYPGNRDLLKSVRIANYHRNTISAAIGNIHVHTHTHKHPHNPHT